MGDRSVARSVSCANALALGLLLAAAGRGPQGPRGPAVRGGMANPVINLDPRVGADEASQKAHQLLYNTLVRIDDNSLAPADRTSISNVGLYRE